MLPKIHLHDRGRVLSVICTNNFQAMDDAVKRGGRVDHIIAIGPPDRESRKRILETAITDDEKWRDKAQSLQHCEDVIEELAQRTEGFTRTELIRAARKVYELGWVSSRDAA